MEETPELKTLRIAVRRLAESITRQGDLISGGWELVNSFEAVKAHQRVQASRPPEYQGEVPLGGTASGHGFHLQVEGRADGVFDYGSSAVLEEIKTTRHSLDDLLLFENPVHWAQARIYSYLLWKSRELKSVATRLTYVQLDTREERSTERSWSFDELEAFFLEAADRYLHSCRRQLEWLETRNASARELEFPFEEFRAGQRDLAVAVYQTIRDRGQLLAQAPTGIGKTVGAIFPAVKAMGEGLLKKAFFLTARGTGQGVALRALEDLGSRGLRLRSLHLTARDKICFDEAAGCSPEQCEFARGFYDRLDDGIARLLETGLMSREAIETAAKECRLCPFELSLEMIPYADFVICDYNYVFDPQVYLRRGLEDDGDPVLYLVDEAHNLVDRSREMYSAALTRGNLLETRRLIRDADRRLATSLSKVTAWMRRKRLECDGLGGRDASEEKPADLFPLLARCLRNAEKLLARRPDLPPQLREAAAQLYFDIAHFLRIGEGFDGRYRTLYHASGKDLTVRLFCVDPSNRLEESLKRAGSAVFLSATLEPVDYFREVLGCAERALELRVPSPFPAENLCVLVMHRASTLYRRREETRDAITQCLLTFVRRRKGNYLLFFPSYEYLSLVLDSFLPEVQGFDVLVQEPGMNELDRLAFLERFSAEPERSLAGFAVMGGIFGEAIDLVGERLTGAAIVGVGLPGICQERDLIRDYYGQKLGRGFEFAYSYPGINRVLQAAGRVIRSETDRGAVLLIDERFSRHPYRRLLPAGWKPVPVAGVEDLDASLARFWQTLSQG